MGQKSIDFRNVSNGLLHDSIVIGVIDIIKENL